MVMRYGPLQRIWLRALGHCPEGSSTLKIYDDIRAVGHSAGFSYTAGFCYALWAVVQDFVMRYEP
jgi:virulence-associated protein VapD